MGNKLLYADRRPLSQQFSQRKSQLGLPARLIDIARITYFQDYFLEQPHIVGNIRLEIHIVGNMREYCQQYVFPGLLVTDLINKNLNLGLLTPYPASNVSITTYKCA